MAELPGVGLITGSASGIGQATAVAFVRAGCTRLALVDRDEQGLEHTHNMLRQVNGDATILRLAGDITSEAFTESMVEETVKQFGRLDYAVNCAGIMTAPQTSQEISLEEHDRTMNINYRGTFLCGRAEIKAMLKNEPSEIDEVPGQRGSVVHIASTLGMIAKGGTPAYSASKAAIMALTKVDALDFSPQGIRVNCICPGLIETPLATMNNNPEVIKLLDPIVQMTPMNRWGRPREIADAAVFLSSNRASFVQGHAMVVDGGLVIQ